MFDQEEREILEALDNDQLKRFVNAEEEIALAKKQQRSIYLNQKMLP